MAANRHDKFLGCILGHAVGDALGAPFEGLSSDLIYASFGRASEIITHPPKDLKTLYYSDDTQMSIGLLEHLLEHDDVDGDALMQQFTRNYDPKRGYGQGAMKLLESVKFGEDWRRLTRSMFGGGSYGNGAAMRVAPVGLLFCDDPDRVWEQAGISAMTTHTHPLGVEGAQLFALAVALLTCGDAFDHDGFYDALLRRATQEEYQWLLRTAARLTEQDSPGLLGNGLEAHRSVITAIACFTMAPSSYEQALTRALALGNDTDTIMGMAGALSGAHLGLAAVPQNLLGMIEEGPRGLSYIQALAERLYQKQAGMQAKDR